MKTIRAVGGGRTPDFRWLVRAAVATAISGTYMLSAGAAEPAAGETGLEEVQITGSRIVRRDTETTSPLITVEREVLEKSSYISIEQALNELPEFMAGGALFGATAVTGLTAAGDVAGGSGHRQHVRHGAPRRQRAHRAVHARCRHRQPARPGRQSLAHAGGRGGAP